MEVLQINVDNSSSMSVTLGNLTLSATGSGNDQADISVVQVYIDNDNDGQLDLVGDTLLGSGTYSGNNGTVVIPLNMELPAFTNMNLLVVDDFTASASGTYQGNLNAGNISGSSSSGVVQFTGLPVTGAIITILPATATATYSFTPIPSATASSTPTRTWTFVFTATRTATPVPTNTSIPTASATRTPSPTETPSFTPTITAMPSATPTFTYTPSFTLTATEQPGNDKPVLYPNPADGTKPVSLHVPGRAGTSDVTVQIFTVAFRLVQQQVFPLVPAGTDVQVDLKDKTGKPLASGLYYVVVTIEGKRSVGKLLLFR